MPAKKPELIPVDMPADLVPALVAVLRCFASHVHAGRVATADLVPADKLKALPPWAAAWSALTPDEQAHLRRWWSASPIGVARWVNLGTGAHWHIPCGNSP
jgi:hypothetical protein